MTKSKAQILKDIDILMKAHKSLLQGFYTLFSNNLQLVSVDDLNWFAEDLKRNIKGLNISIPLFKDHLQDLKGGKTKNNGKR